MKIFIFQKLQIKDLSFENVCCFRFLPQAIIAAKREYTDLSGNVLCDIQLSSKEQYLVISKKDSRILGRIISTTI